MTILKWVSLTFYLCSCIYKAVSDGSVSNIRSLCQTNSFSYFTVARWHYFLQKSHTNRQTRRVYKLLQVPPFNLMVNVGNDNIAYFNCCSKWYYKKENQTETTHIWMYCLPLLISFMLSLERVTNTVKYSACSVISTLQRFFNFTQYGWRVERQLLTQDSFLRVL